MRAVRSASERRRDPALDRRRVVVYALGLILFYVGVLLVVRPDFSAPGALNQVALGIMFAPTVGALAAVVLAAGRIQFGRPTWWIAAAFVPPLLILAVTVAVAADGDVSMDAAEIPRVLALLPLAALAGSVSAVGEEIGWRGFLWPLLRRHLGFWISAAVTIVVWWAYHAPLIFVGAYGSVSGLPAFTVAIIGFVLFVGVLTERSGSIWPSVLAHGVWNGAVATDYRPEFGGGPVFTGTDDLLGEFGWIAALTMLGIGLATAVWHVRRPITQRATVERGPRQRRRSDRP